MSVLYSFLTFCFIYKRWPFYFSYFLTCKRWQLTTVCSNTFALTIFVTDSLSFKGFIFRTGRYYVIIHTLSWKVWQVTFRQILKCLLSYLLSLKQGNSFWTFSFWLLSRCWFCHSVKFLRNFTYALLLFRTCSNTFLNFTSTSVLVLLTSFFYVTKYTVNVALRLSTS